MATLDEEQQQRSELRSVLDQLVAIEPESLVRTEELGRDLNFEAGLPVFRRTLGLFQDLSGSNLDEVPFETLQQLTGLAKRALQHFQQVQSFTLQQHQANPISARDQFINQIRDQWQEYYGMITPVIAYNAQRGTDFDRLEREARGALSEVQQVATDARKDRDTILAEMKAGMEQIRRAAAEAGVAQHAIHFKEEAESHNNQSIRWLRAAVGFAVLTGAYAFYALEVQRHDIVANAPLGSLIQLALAKIVIISILSYGLVFSARNYAASRHNLVINRHRQNALSTFETFVKAASDPQTKDAVLIQATQSIFSPQTSGYLHGEGETAAHGSQIVELVRGVTGTKD